MKIEVVDGVNGSTIVETAKAMIEPGSVIRTDGLASYIYCKREEVQSFKNTVGKPVYPQQSEAAQPREGDNGQASILRYLIEEERGEYEHKILMIDTKKKKAAHPRKAEATSPHADHLKGRPQ